MAIAEKLQGWRDAASEIELDQIDWEEPGTWPALVKSGLMILAVLLTALLGYIFVVKAQLDGLNSAEGEELALRAEFQAKAFEARYTRCQYNNSIQRY